MEGKKISFGFKKTIKVDKPVVEENKEFIECLEEKSIKVVGGEPVKEKEPLVIPMQKNTLITAERLKQIADKVESSLDEPMQVKENTVEIKSEPVEGLTLDELAVKELLEDSKKDVKVEKQELTVAVPSKPVIEGQKESTLEDYESVPIQDFGMAMLRGMGWTPDKENLAKYKQPPLRPKGLGLGADKVINEKQKKKASNKNDKEQELAIVKNCYVKIVAGKYSGYYGKVVSLDEDNGRVMVDIIVKKETVSLSEFMMQPVTKAEFDKESKVINTDAYQQYKINELSQTKKPTRNESPLASETHRRDSPKLEDKGTSSGQRYDNKKEKKEEKYNGVKESKKERSRKDISDNDRRRKEYKRDSSSSEDRNKKKNRRDSSSEDRSSRIRKRQNKRDSTSSEDRSRKNKEVSRKDFHVDMSRKKEKRYSSNESISSHSDSDKKKKHKHNKKHRDSSDTVSDEQAYKKDKRDIDKKRKGKKKKRDRDRSPNYKKHRK